MKASMSGDLDVVHKLAVDLDRLASEGMRDAEHRAAVAVDLQVERQFARGESAEGTRWANKADGSPSYLQASGAMKRTKRVSGVGGIKLTIDRPAGWHQSGTKTADGSERMPARTIAPTGDTLPPNWSKSIKDAVGEVFAEVGR